ncbi:O-antigen ligase family protein [Microbacterium sp. cx-55]|uniref:O-antigen ligase family protein n=1 Tax=Microbacterium sp. cx-55 TaxID=2875948 RepID=UPI001CBDE7D4|nr:O-antigen ligase family protein [Microbacterium sp. cx-55]MBZ4486837.1 O-antigen ligase family protein [Microbacterium sp. cx-55]UGB35766.1 O-antigen ligase family protein [Microbacterium sp. cx-55]
MAGVWMAALLLIPLGGLISGITTSVAASLVVAIPLALLVGLAPPVLRYYVETSPAFGWWVGSAFVLSQTASAAVGLLQLSGTSLFGTTAIFGRSTGLADHPNVLGVMSVLAMLACFAAFVAAPAFVKVVVLFAIVVNFAALIGTGSLSAMLAGAVACFIALVVRRRTILAVILGATSVAILSLFLGVAGLDPAALVEPVNHRFNVVIGAADDGGAASVGTRVQTYEWAWRFISENPLVGVGMDATNAATYNGYTPVHNYVLHAWYRGGLFFVAWQIAATIGYICLVVRAVRSGQRAIAAATVAAVVTFAATSAFFDQPHYWLPLLFAIVLLPRSAGARSRLRTKAQLRTAARGCAANIPPTTGLA